MTNPVAPSSKSNSAYTPSWVAIGILSASLASIAYIMYFSPPALEQHRYLLPILTGMVAFPAAILTIIYCLRVVASLNLASKVHAFGLPPGSIRAVLALGFIVLVLIFGVFTITEVGNQRQILIDAIQIKIDQVQPAEIQKPVSPGNPTPSEQKSYDQAVVAYENALEKAVSTAKSQTEEAYKLKVQNKFLELRKGYEKQFMIRVVEPVSGGLSEIHIYTLANNDRVAQLSQQILTMIATALTAIVGFYFGSRTASEPNQTDLLNTGKTLEKVSSLKLKIQEIFDKASFRLSKIKIALDVAKINIPDDIETISKLSKSAIEAKLALIKTTLDEYKVSLETAQKASALPGDAAEEVTKLHSSAKLTVKKIKQIGALIGDGSTNVDWAKIAKFKQ